MGEADEDPDFSGGIFTGLCAAASPELSVILHIAGIPADGEVLGCCRIRLRIAISRPGGRGKGACGLIPEKRGHWQGQDGDKRRPRRAFEAFEAAWKRRCGHRPSVDAEPGGNRILQVRPHPFRRGWTVPWPLSLSGLGLVSPEPALETDL